MKVQYRSLVASLLALCLAACGGGSGGESGGGGAAASGTVAPNPAGNWLTFDPSSPVANQYEGEGTSVSVTATASRTFSSAFNVAIVDPKGVVTGEVSMAALSETSFRATFRTAATLAAGTHSTTLEVRVCEDAPLTCAKPFPGSPWRVPLTVQVKPRAEAVARLTLATPTVSVTTYPGEAASFKVEAQLNKELAARNANMGIFDPAGLTVAPAQFTLAENGRYVSEVTTAISNNLAPGTYTSNLQLRMCEDNIRICERPVAGSPWTIPLTVTVKSGTNLSMLANIDGLGSWSTHQGNPGHTGFVDASFDTSVFLRRWRVAADSDYSQALYSAAIDSGRVFFVRRNAANASQLVAVSEDTGEIAWKVELGMAGHANSPAVANGRVYLTSAASPEAYLWVFDQVSGALLKKQPMYSREWLFSAPTILGTDVYTLTDGLYKYSDLTGTRAWSVGLSSFTGWSPATDGQFAYVYDGSEKALLAFNSSDGRPAFRIGDPETTSVAYFARTVVLTGTGKAVVAADKLVAFDLATRTRAWVLNTATNGKAAYGNGTVYAFGPSGRTFEARAPETGNLAWTTEDLGDKFSELVVTRNLAFVSSGTRTAAIDLATHRVVWTYPRGGALAISQRGVLYILTDKSELSAINLR